MPRPTGKWNQHLHKACQQKEAWSALKCPGRWLRWLWTSENTVNQIIIWLWKLHTGLQEHGFCVSPLFLQTLGPWFPNEKQNVLLSEKRTLDHWATVQFFFSFAQVRCFWWCFWFRSGLVALFLKMSERGDCWCTDSSFSSLLVKLSQVFESALLDCILKLAVIPVACAPCPTQFLPVNFACNMLWNSTPWTAPSFSNDPLWLTLFVEAVNSIQFNSIFIYIAHLKTTMVDQSASQCPEKLPHKQNEYSKTSQCLNSTQNKSQGKQVCLKKWFKNSNTLSSSYVHR